MNTAELSKIVDAAWERRAEIGLKTKGPVRKAVAEAIALLDSGQARVAERQTDGNWHVNQWLKKAVLLSFRLEDTALIKGGPGRAAWWDKVPSKFDGWTKAHFKKAGFRAVPGAIVRRGAYHRAERRADAELRQSRRLRGRSHHDRHLGHGRLLRPDRQELPHFRRRRHRRRAWSRCRRAPW